MWVALSTVSSSDMAQAFCSPVSGGGGAPHRLTVSYTVVASAELAAMWNVASTSARLLNGTFWATSRGRMGGHIAAGSEETVMALPTLT